MTSTSVTTVGGVVVVTQVIPKDESTSALQTAAAAARQAPPPAAQAPASKDDMTATFLRGGPHGLGLVQIFIGVLCVLFSVTAVFSQILILHAPLCLAVTFVMSGSVAVAAARRTSVGLVWASLLSHMISVLLGLVGVTYVCFLLADRPPSERFCDKYSDGFVPTDQQKLKCHENMDNMDICVYGLLGLLLVLLVLQVCVTVTVCVFSGRALRRSDCYVPVMVEYNDESVLVSGAASGLDSDVALLDGKGEETSTPPPYSP
ncbi:membrane-spanning 4-domains subfamily A member 4A [Cottoperca gobio]|uniref:Membrane-spanning 4-domains subfamily A member 4A n=1 Tax=Cottoperca gobio TaxID=56716 RepID=A0A6J2PD18_COTGO|nr:membrane-spanning 4-domains subfamily A member 4A [Cottoperca gobio]XP_029283506.1 membrane-spanning 4-domains subfamily A member 4A [Cottoperca gobio]